MVNSRSLIIEIVLCRDFGDSRGGIIQFKDLKHSMPINANLDFEITGSPQATALLMRAKSMERDNYNKV